MKLIRYQSAGGVGVGVEVDDGTVRATPWAAFEALFDEADPGAAVRALEVERLPIVHVTRRLSPTVGRPQLIGTGGNYPDHAAEASAEIRVSEPVFVPFLWGAMIGPDDEIVIPTEDTLTDYEVELAVVIGRTARNLSPETAMDHVFGFTIVNDVSARDVTRDNVMQMMLSKSVTSFLPVGPCVVTTDAMPDPDAVRLRSFLNGEPRQDGNTSTATYGFAEILTRITSVVTLHPGDIVTSGTPGGVGYFRTPPEFVAPGDTVGVEVDGIGRMTNRAVRARTP